MSKNSHFSAKDLLLGPGHRSTVTCEREAYALPLVSTCTSASIARDNRPACTLLPTYYRYSAGHLGASKRPNLLVYSQLFALPVHTLNAIARQILKQYGLCQCVNIFYQSKCLPWQTFVIKVATFRFVPPLHNACSTATKCSYRSTTVSWSNMNGNPLSFLVSIHWLAARPKQL